MSRNYIVDTEVFWDWSTWYCWIQIGIGAMIILRDNPNILNDFDWINFCILFFNNGNSSDIGYKINVQDKVVKQQLIRVAIFKWWNYATLLSYKIPLIFMVYGSTFSYVFVARVSSLITSPVFIPIKFIMSFFVLLFILPVLRRNCFLFSTKPALFLFH